MTRRSWQSSWSALGAKRAILVALMTLGCPAQGEPYCDPTNPQNCAQELSKGEIAPFDGQLLSVDLAIDLGQKATFCDKRLNLELKFQEKRLNLKLDLEKRLHEIDSKAWESERKLLLTRLEEASSPPWYEHPAFVATVSVILTVGVIWGARETLKAW